MKNMTKTELLFLEEHDECITYDEFKYAGWTMEDFLEYLKICEEIRAALICMSCMDNIVHLKNNELKELKNEIFKALMDTLSKCISKFLENPIHLNCEIDYLNSDLTYFFESSIYASSDDFRHGIEILIYIKLSNDLSWLIGSNLRLYSKETLQNELQSLKDEYFNNEKPIFPNNIVSYSDLQNWAKKYADYDYVEKSYPEKIEYLQEYIDNYGADSFAAERDTMYIYAGMPKCLQYHAFDIQEVAVRIPVKNGHNNILNAHYCSECKKFFITYDEYQCYVEKFKYMPLRLEKISDENDNGNDTFYGRREHSDLSLCGYTVANNAQLSEDERHDLLAQLLEMGVFKKWELINHLEMLINTNGMRDNMDVARRKWKEDMFFISNYKLDRQPQHEIRDMEIVSKRIRVLLKNEDE